MTTAGYRTAVIGGAIAWFMLVLHAPIVHQIMDHGQLPSLSVSIAVAILVLAAVASVWVLLRWSYLGAGG